MQENLNIEVQLKDKAATLLLSGRLDANWAGHLDENIEKLVRTGIYDMQLDTSGIVYISSAGIRILVKQYKNLQSVGGNLSISAFSPQVEEVLNMVGMVPMFSKKKTSDIPDTTLSEEAYIADGFRFMPTQENESARMKISLQGDPELMRGGQFTTSSSLEFGNDRYAVGIGAIGSDFDDCKHRFGEFLALGDAVAYMPGDKSGVPDYTLRTGELIPRIESLYAIIAEGKFGTRYRFLSDGNERTIGLSALLDAVRSHQKREDLVFMMIAESGGLVGTALNSSPVEGNTPFSFPEIRDRINFTTEPAHPRMLAVCTGIISNGKTDNLLPYIRPLTPEKELFGHVHCAVFPYHTLKKRNLEMKDTLHMLFEESEILDILHLTNDTREIQGLGESQFIHGYIWCAPATM